MNAIQLHNKLRIFCIRKQRVKFSAFIVISVVVTFYIITFVSNIKTDAYQKGKENTEAALKHTTRKLKLSKLCDGSGRSIYNRSHVRNDWDLNIFVSFQ